MYLVGAPLADISVKISGQAEASFDIVDVVYHPAANYDMVSIYIYVYIHARHVHIYVYIYGRKAKKFLSFRTLPCTNLLASICMSSYYNVFVGIGETEDAFSRATSPVVSRFV
jgi:hypothetical protein